MTDKYVHTCPICSTPIPVLPGEDINAKMDVHISSGCQDQKIARERSRNERRCRFPGCKKVELIPFECGHCHLKYCLAHRITERHSCAQLKAPSTQQYRQIGPFRVPIPAAAPAKQPSDPKEKRPSNNTNSNPGTRRSIYVAS
jgi:hypothetical protein